MEHLMTKVVACFAAAAFLSLGLVPSIDAGLPSAVKVRAAELAQRVAGEQVFSLPFRASHIALHWPGHRDAHVSVRLSRDGVTFGPVQPVEVDDDGELGPETYSSLLVAPRVTAIQVSADRAIPRISVLALDTTTKGHANGQGRSLLSAPPVRAGASQPAVISRAGWGADETIRTNVPGFYPIQKVIVHHTATANNDPNPPATVRAIYYYHAITRGRGDMIYNFLIDEAGNVYEGRYSRPFASGETPTGEDLEGRGVAPGQTSPYNRGLVAISLLGNFVDRAPTAAALGALKLMLAWKTGRHNIDPLASGPYVDPVNGATLTLANISGHRNIYATDCPGAKLYALLPSIRADVAARLGSPDVTAPRVGRPIERFPMPSQLRATLVPVRFSSASVDTESGVARNELQFSTAGGTWMTVRVSDPAAAATWLWLVPARSYRVRTRSIDGAGNASSWVASPSLALSVHQESSAAIAYAGSWRAEDDATAYGGHLLSASSSLASARVTFYGRDVAWVTARGPNRGKANVYIDGTYVQTVDLFARSAVPRAIAFSRRWSVPGSHTLRVRVLGTAGRPRVDLDAFAILR